MLLTKQAAAQHTAANPVLLRRVIVLVQPIDLAGQQ
jgi:hypothetical protein